MPPAPPNPKPPRVSVIIPVRNGAQFIGWAIDSILSQTLTDLELLVVDDASTDHTPEVIQSYTDPRLRYLHNPQCLGSRLQETVQWAKPVRHTSPSLMRMTLRIPGGLKCKSRTWKTIPRLRWWAPTWTT